MQALELVIETKDGVVTIPKKYLKGLKQTVRVIILIEEKNEKPKTFPKKG